MNRWFHPAFEVELIEAARYLEHQRGDFGRQFLNEVEAAIGTIMEAPASPTFRICLHFQARFSSQEVKASS